jgi:hypothetical protein
MKSVQLAQKTKNRATTWSSNSTPGTIYPKEMRSVRLKHICTTSRVHYSSVHHSHKMEATSVSITGWMDRENVATYTTEYNSVIKKWNSVICDNMDETRRHRHRNTNTTRSHSDVDCEKAALMEVERRRVVTRGWEGEGTGAIGRCWSMDRKLQSDSLMCCLVL